MIYVQKNDLYTYGDNILAIFRRFVLRTYLRTYTLKAMVCKLVCIYDIYRYRVDIRTDCTKESCLCLLHYTVQFFIFSRKIIDITVVIFTGTVRYIISSLYGTVPT